MPKFQQTYIDDPDWPVRIGFNPPGQPASLFPARLEAIFMRGARLLVDGPTVPVEGEYVDLILGHPEPFLWTGGKVAVAHPTAEGPHVIWLNFDEYCRGEPLHRARDLIKALR